MSKSNSIIKQANIRAFWSVFDEYILLKSRSAVYVSSYDRNMSKNNEGDVMRRLAMPSPADFCADVELAWESYLKPRNMLSLFIDEYLNGENAMTKGQKLYAENFIGEIFKKRGIHPVKGYFLSKRVKHEPNPTI